MGRHARAHHDCEFQTAVDAKVFEQICKLVPAESESKRANLHCVFPARFSLGKHSRTRGFVAVTPHYISFFKKEKTALLISVPIISISGLVVVFNAKLTIKCKVHHIQSISVASDHIIKLSQVVWRNVSFHFMRLQPAMQARLDANDDLQFPKITISISPAQSLQFRYSAFCVKDGHERYDHRFIQRLNRQFLVSDYVFDTGRFHTDKGFGPLSHAVFSSSHFLSLFITEQSDLDPVAAIVECCENEQPLVAVNIQTAPKASLAPLARALRKHPIPICVWKINCPSFSHTGLFVRALSGQTIGVKVLDFCWMGLSEKHGKTILKELRQSLSLRGVEVLGLSGLHFSHSIKNKFLKFVVSANAGTGQQLKHLKVSGIGFRAGKVALSLLTNRVQLETLDVSNNDLTDWAVSQILQLVKRTPTLYDVDVSQTDYSIGYYGQLVNVFASNGCQRPRILRLNALKGSGKIFSQILAAILDTPGEAWGGFSFDSNRFDLNLVKLTISVMSVLPNLEFMSLSGIFSMPEVGVHLAKLLDIKSLKVLILRGEPGKRLKGEAKPLIQALATNRTLDKLDLSENAIGPKLFDSLCGSFEKNSHLHILAADGNEIRDFKQIQKFVKIASQRPQTLNILFPRNDIKQILSQTAQSEHGKLLYQIHQLKLDLELALDSHRVGTKFERFPYDDMDEPIRKILSEASFMMDESPHMQKRNVHSCAASLFHLPFPFQNPNQQVESVLDTKLIAQEAMIVFDTPSMLKIVAEQPLIVVAHEEGEPEDAQSRDAESLDDGYERRRLKYSFDTTSQPLRANGKVARPIESDEESDEDIRARERLRLAKILRTEKFPELEFQNLIKDRSELVEDDSDSLDSTTSKGKHLDSDEEEEDEEMPPIRRKQKADDDSSVRRIPPNRKGTSDDDSSRSGRRSKPDSDDHYSIKRPKSQTKASSDDDNDRASKRARSAGPAAMRLLQIVISDEEDDDSKAHSKPKREAGADDRAKRRRTARRASSDSEQTSSEGSGKENKRRPSKRKLSSDDDSDKPVRRQSRLASSDDDSRTSSRRTSKRKLSSDDDSDKPTRRRRPPSSDDNDGGASSRRRPTGKRRFDDDDSERPTPRRKRHPSSSDDDRPMQRRRTRQLSSDSDDNDSRGGTSRAGRSHGRSRRRRQESDEEDEPRARQRRHS